MSYDFQVCSPLPRNDSKLVQIVDTAFADAARRSGPWLLCRSGCTQCCSGVFPINQLDAARLKQGMAKLEEDNPDRAEAVRKRARESVARLASDFPGNAQAGILSEEADLAFEEFGNDEPCPALIVETGECAVYASRPMTCRVFGPPIRSGQEEGLGVCELCFHGATAEEIASCEMKPGSDELESRLNEEVEQATGVRGETIVAYALLT
ncbi:MAG: hypothetical protein JWO13_1631 [Acidobacteriales bacterium]|nr:hypothetical protein [Terriglobales bacterium]